MGLYMMTPDSKLVEWKGLQRVEEPIFESSSYNEHKFSLGDICEFHCKLETDQQAWQQLIYEMNQQTMTAFDLLKQATLACLNNKCDECPIKQNDASCQDWVEKNIETLIENQKRLYVQMTTYRKERINNVSRNND